MNQTTESNTPQWDTMIASICGGKTLDGADSVSCDEDYQEKADSLGRKLELELAAKTKQLKDEQDRNWTASLCDRLNELLREHPIYNEVADGQSCSYGIQAVHGYCGSLKWKIDTLGEALKLCQGIVHSDCVEGTETEVNDGCHTPACLALQEAMKSTTP